MPMIREMQRLRAEHAALVTLSHILAGMVRAPRPPRATALLSARSLFRDTLLRHLKCEDWVLYPRLKASGDPELIRITREFELEMGDLAMDFTAYDDKWTIERAEAAWLDFCRETAIMLEILGTRIEREERDLYPLAEKLRPAQSVIDTGAGRGRTGHFRSSEPRRA
ncbi:hemerythrin-like domain-containing protein [Sphingopyxis panaciterrae]|uniref:hemerythrin domain-containing protein n=1 Tax=Sphingopyxis panaciterrae TaxID=363841 RepID=UPI00142476FB|nr:hemerythrin domain-containing protein [Sphingopyxis panaciterrae]NIJ39163.1 hemerythrin-like domain-containing protein [Sphingopyxis panaciterrae]